MQAVRGERETACEFAQRGRFAFGDTVTVIGVVVATLPAASYARALRVWLPLSLRAFQLKLYGYEVSTSFSAPSIHNSTLATPTLSVAPTATVTLPETAVPSVGEVIATVGGVASATVTM
jgi:hypothetical protein